MHSTNAFTDHKSSPVETMRSVEDHFSIVRLLKTEENRWPTTQLNISAGQSDQYVLTLLQGIKSSYRTISTKEISLPIPSRVLTMSEISFIKVSIFSFSWVGTPWINKLFSLFLFISPTCVDISPTLPSILSMVPRNPAISLKSWIITIILGCCWHLDCWDTYRVELAMSLLMRVLTRDLSSSRFPMTESWISFMSRFTFHI